MPIEIVPTTETDCERFTQLDTAAFGASSDSVFQAVLFPATGPALNTDGVVESMSSKRARAMARMMREDSSAYFIKAVDTELSGVEAVVGFAKWHVWREGMPPSPKRDWGGSGCNAEACDEFFGGINKLKDRLMVGKNCVYLQPVVTQPGHQRRGIGRRLIEWGLDNTTRLNLPAFLIASADGHSLYKKCGFVDVDEVSMDFSAFGVPEVCTSWAMIRK